VAQRRHQRRHGDERGKGVEAGGHRLGFQGGNTWMFFSWKMDEVC